MAINTRFREAVLADKSKIVKFQVEMAFESEGLRLDLETCTKGVDAVFNKPQLGTYYVAEEGAELIASLLIIPEWSDWRNGVVWWIHSVYVIPTARRAGVFSSFYKFVETHGKSVAKIRGLRLYVDKGNVAAQKVYQKLGMSNQHYDLYEQLF